MSLRIQVISGHPLVVRSLERILSADRTLKPLLLPSITNTELPPKNLDARLFVIDVFTCPMKLIPLVRILRMRVRKGKFLALVTLEEGGDDSMLRLLHNGIDGVAVLSSDCEAEIRAAVRAISAGDQWAPSRVLQEYLDQSRVFLDRQALPELGLTGREGQVLQLMLRRLSNSEIGEAMGISERTVRFHVSNIFAKMRVNNRRGLLAALTGLARESA